MEQKLTHWTKIEDKEELLNRNFRPLTRHFIKPHGFWISVNESWENWTKSEWKSWMDNKTCLQIELDKDINLFVIRTKGRFLEKFKELTGAEYPTFSVKNKYEIINLFHKKLKELYDGVWLLSKPFYEHRLDGYFDYFYLWDCESICVWNMDKIKFVGNKNE